MKNYIVLIIIILISSCQKSEEKKNIINNIPVEIDSAYVKSKLAYFKVKNNIIEGKGKQLIEKIVNESQFIVFGENHYSKQTSILTKALIPLLSKAYFTNFLAEVGPSTAEKLIELSTPYEKTVENLKEFTTKYKHDEFGNTGDPIPFFAGVEDAEFLQLIRKYNINFHGIDQEYIYSALFFMDELLKEAKSKPNYEEIKQLKEKVDKLIYNRLKDDKKGKTVRAMEAFETNKNIITFFNQFEEGDTKARKIINDLRFSWDIYKRWRKGSHFDRVSYMRNNILKVYKKQKDAKLFIKVGSLHAAKNISNSSYDIGYLTEELAQKKHTVSSSINSWRPFYIDGDSIVNAIEKYKRYYRRLGVFTQFAKKNKWTIIDFKSIKEDIKSNKVKLPINGDYHALKKLLDGYDYQLIIPVDDNITYNLKK